MRQTTRNTTGFTLIELMIVVAIIGILAATSIPQFMRFQLRSKAGEGRLNLVTIRAAERSYFGEYGTFVRMLPEPQTTGPALAPPSSSKRAWTVCPIPIAMTDPGNCVMGFMPEGPTYFDYAVGTVNANTALGAGTMNVDCFIAAEADIDGDTVPAAWGIQVPDLGGGIAAPSPFASCAAIFDESGNPGLFDQIGPCGLGMGFARF